VNHQERRLQLALDEFLEAFRNLEWSTFIASFAAEATVFFPFENTPRRAGGVEEIAAIFSPYFTSRRDRQPEGPPYLQLDPQDLRIAIAGNMGLVTFHLHDVSEAQAVLCRRTFVWIDDGTQWRILHLHASNLPDPRFPSASPGNINSAAR